MMIEEKQKIKDKSINIVNWSVESPKAVLLIVHGFAEHAVRYNHVAQFFNINGFHVRSYDLSGHGKSEGLAAYIDQFSEYEDELEEIVIQMNAEFESIPKFVLGHSMGGLITGINVIKKKLGGIQNIILTNPALDITSNQPNFLVGLVRFLAKVFPKMKTVKLDSQYISKDPAEVAKYDNDPLVYRGGTRPRMVDQFDKAGQWLRNNASKFDANVLLVYSKSDKVVYPFASKDFFEVLKSEDKTLKEYEGLYHEVLNEPEREEVMKTILDWIKKRM